MKIYHSLEERHSERPLVIAVGFFDGMHRGHMEIARAARRLRKPGWRCGVLSFHNHPAAFLRPGNEPPMLTTNAERIDLFALAGFEECFLVPFDAAIATLAPEAFLDRLIALGVCGVAVGTTFRFGHKRAGNVEMMREYLTARGVQCATVENVLEGSERVSSTRIRSLIAEGRCEEADGLLGHSYELRGVVEVGFGRGHDLGFPTANVSVPAKLIPKDGVYAAVSRHDGRDYAALVSIGTNPQFNGTRRTVEVWMRDFHRSIYGHELVIRDLRFVREQMTFDSVEELIAQMQTDLQAVAYPSYG